jgi:3-hydroxybutyryl-CoA dehydratase
MMAQADAFETDFWKHANLRKVWDDIVPGEPRKTIPYTLTRDAIELYCASVGEDHPLYFDEDYAKTTVYRGLIAPPSIHILLMFSCTPADDWMRSPGTVNAGQSWSYNIPARPGDVIRLEARALDKFIKRERLFVVQCLLQPAWLRHLLGPRLDHSAAVSEERKHDSDIRKASTPATPSTDRNSRSAANPSACSATRRSTTTRCISTTII